MQTSKAASAALREPTLSVRWWGFASANPHHLTSPLTLPQALLGDLAVLGVRQARQEDHPLGRLVVGQAPAAMLDHLALAKLRTLLQHHEGVDGLAPLGVGHAEDGVLHDRRV